MTHTISQVIEVIDSFVDNLRYILSLFEDDHDPDLELRAMERRIACIDLLDDRRVYIYIKVKLED